MKKFITIAAAAAVLAIPAAASAGSGYSTQPGFASCNGSAHGAFGAFSGDHNLAGGSPAYHDGAVGQEAGATGFNNSTAASLCNS
ncbi:MAG: hypothetical protein ACRDNP_08765 [Gaiellaceae bacterium]